MSLSFHVYAQFIDGQGRSTVTWANKDCEPHSMVSDTDPFRSGAVDTNESYSYKFDKPGAYPYHCALHPRMVATIFVQ
jgi:plastocyanin